MLPKGIFVSGNSNSGDTGKPTEKKPAIVFLHSSLSSSRQWFPLIRQLEQNFICINIDILGYGKADKVVDHDNYSFEIEAKRINEAIQFAIGDGQYHLVGHSCGGAIALKIAVEAPDKLLSISLFEPVAFHLLPEGSKERALSDDFAKQVAIEDSYKAAEIFTNFWNKEGFFASLPKKMQALMANDMPKVNLDFIGLTSESYTLDDVAKIKVPSQIITGQFSPALSHFLAEKLIVALPYCQHKEVPAGHMAPVSHGELVFPLISSFIRT